MQRLLLADRVKSREDSFLAPLLPALSQVYNVSFLSLGPGECLERAIRESDVVWLEWCWDHAVWATRSGALEGKPCVVRLHSIEALQTDYPSQVDWSAVSCLVTVGEDITDVLCTRFPQIARQVPIETIPNGIDLRRFASGKPERHHIAWVGHLEPKKNPMLLLQVAHRLQQVSAQYRISVAGLCTDLRTGRYLQHMIPMLQLQHTLKFDGVVREMPAWYADKGVLLSTTMLKVSG